MCSIATAYVQDARVQRGGYRSTMQPEQRIIADWMLEVMARKGWTPQQWADQVGFSATNITRALKDKFASVTTVRTLDQLARAANVPSVLDFLKGYTSKPALNVNEVSGVLAEILRSAPNWSAADAPRLAEGLLYGLGLATADPANPATAETLKVAGRAAADRLRDSKIEA